METIQVNIPLNLNELANLIVNKLAFSNLDFNQKGKDSEEILYTREETAKRLSISLPTLNEYTKRGIIIGNRLGRRVLYKQSDIEAALKAIRIS